MTVPAEAFVRSRDGRSALDPTRPGVPAPADPGRVAAAVATLLAARVARGDRCRRAVLTRAPAAAGRVDTERRRALPDLLAEPGENS
ncbi:hypothetical protein [Pseudonocardia sp.]|uniref:hypothetical protein n=1 Tax=Pseudonocardia sp. TaxID=60912 RepID=UPI002614C9E6|nr:hypothetical protein [Pseudonocardia sp.]